jgi:hypothetical protein
VSTRREDGPVDFPIATLPKDSADDYHTAPNSSRFEHNNVATQYQDISTDLAPDGRRAVENDNVARPKSADGLIE